MTSFGVYVCETVISINIDIWKHFTLYLHHLYWLSKYIAMIPVFYIRKVSNGLACSLELQLLIFMFLHVVHVVLYSFLTDLTQIKKVPSCRQ